MIVLKLSHFLPLKQICNIITKGLPQSKRFGAGHTKMFCLTTTARNQVCPKPFALGQKLLWGGIIV